MKWNDPKIYGAGTIAPDPGWRMAPHSHAFHEIVAIQQGRLHLKAGGQAIVARRGDVLFYPAGLVHEETSDPQAPVRSCFFAFSTGTASPGFPIRSHDGDGRVRQLIEWIVEDERARRPSETRRAMLETLFDELRRICGAPPDPWLGNVLAFARKNLAQRLRLDDLARHGKMSRFAFVRKFKRLCGRTPMEELRLIRLDQARTLLLTTNLPVKAIAPEVGIGDEYQLSKLFRSHFHLSPRDLRIRN